METAAAEKYKASMPNFMGCGLLLESYGVGEKGWYFYL
jgi:hypothetical protein